MRQAGALLWRDTADVWAVQFQLTHCDESKSGPWNPVGHVHPRSGHRAGPLLWADHDDAFEYPECRPVKVGSSEGTYIT